VNISGSLADLLPVDALASSDQDFEWSASGSPPEVIVRPGSTDEVAAVMSWASEEGVGVLPIGSGRRAPGVHGSDPYIGLSTTRLTGIEIYDSADLTLTAAAGTSLATIDEVLRDSGQWVPFDPPHVLDRTVGGLVAMGESGPLCTGYGALRNHVLGMTVVTGDGRTLRLGGRVVKNVAGYDVLKPMVGSGGSLSVITSVCVRAFPEPAIDRLLVLRGESVTHLATFAQAIGTAAVMPVSSVLVDALDALDDGPALVVRLQGERPTVDSDQAVLERHVGVVFDSVPNADHVRVALRDHGADPTFVVSILPSRLSEGLAVLDRLDPLIVAVDTYAARIRMSVAEVDTDAIGRARESIERLGGALRMCRRPGPKVRGDLDTRLSLDEMELTSRLVDVFDPSGVLWPTRGSRT
jgi:ketosteroid isomerase-like protein